MIIHAALTTDLKYIYAKSFLSSNCYRFNGDFPRELYFILLDYGKYVLT